MSTALIDFAVKYAEGNDAWLFSICVERPLRAIKFDKEARRL
jgi:hypothetical protein